MPKDLKVYYKSEEGIDVEFDKKIEEFFKSLGYSRWASGCNIKTGVRDLAFDPNDDIAIKP